MSAGDKQSGFLGCVTVCNTYPSHPRCKRDGEAATQFDDIWAASSSNWLQWPACAAASHIVNFFKNTTMRCTMQGNYCLALFCRTIRRYLLCDINGKFAIPWFNKGPLCWVQDDRDFVMNLLMGHLGKNGRSKSDQRLKWELQLPSAHVFPSSFALHSLRET